MASRYPRLPPAPGIKLEAFLIASNACGGNYTHTGSRNTECRIAPSRARYYRVAASASTMPDPNRWRLPIASAVVFSQERTSPGVQ